MTNMLLKSQPGLVITPEQAERHDAEVALAKLMAEILQKFYPLHRWATFADTEQGIVWIALPDLMGPSLRYVEHCDRISDYLAMCKWLKSAGGEILERWRLGRGKRDDAAYAEASKKAITDHATEMPE